MQIELDAATVARIRKTAEDQAVRQLFTEIMAQFDVKQIANEVKNAAIKEAAHGFANEIRKTHKTSEVVTRALQGAEEKVRSEIQKKLTNGITVKFQD